MIGDLHYFTQELRKAGRALCGARVIPDGPRPTPTHRKCPRCVTILRAFHPTPAPSTDPICKPSASHVTS